MKISRLFFFFAFMAFSLSLSAQKKGDVNLDKTVDISDVVAVINTIAGSTAYKTTADVNGDNTIDISDVVAIINIIANGSPDEAVVAGLCPDSNHPHIIDMGEAGKWSCCNVGASAPWEYGGYYAWGETEEKDYYAWSTYIHCDGSSSTCHNLGSDISGTQYDVAHVKWGGKWRMPSLDQQMLLLDNCTSEWTNVNGINGRKFTAANGGSIFLPAAGGRWSDGTDNFGSDGYYWSSTQHPGSSDYAYSLSFDGGGAWGYGSRRSGRSVRPVTE